MSKAVWRPMAAVGGLIWHREIVMDIKDLDGDKLAGVRTLPVAFGAKRALLLSLFPLSLATIAAATGVGGPLAALPLLTSGACGAFAQLRLLARHTRGRDRAGARVAVRCVGGAGGCGVNRVG